ncbi:MAG: LysM peptidoglycan-binding domain-containing protein [Gemmatimonadaceae bacterium]|jgi:LysM repeat protein|nr:LysM peptidoglycan-binding domain-containing protein [Gemmatimonadaceae bacterium]
MAALSLEELVIDRTATSGRAMTRLSRVVASHSTRWLLAGCALLLAELLIAAAVRAQAQPAEKPAAVKTSTATHTVQAGETLWSIAQRYLGNPRRWRDVAAANGLPMDAQRKLPVGKVLQLPGALRTADGSAGVDMAPSAAVTPVPAAQSGAAPSAPAQPAAAEPARDDGRSALFMRSARRYEIGVRVDRDPEAPVADGPSVHLTPKPRMGEAVAAPFVVALSELERGPALGDRIAMNATTSSEFEPMIRLRDAVTVRAGKGAALAAGQQFVVVKDEGGLEKGRLVDPTGLVVLEQKGAELVARVMQVYGRVEPGQRLLPITGDVPPAEAKAVALASGDRALKGVVRYVDSDPLLPTLQRYLVMTGGSSWKVGDEVELRTPKADAPARGWASRLLSMGTTDAPAPPRANELVGRARVVRVTPLSVTAVVVHHEQPLIAAGTMATLVARLP